MRTLVTGAGGFAGSHLIELLEEGGDEIVGWLRPDTEPLVRGRRTRWMTVELLHRDQLLCVFLNPRADQTAHRVHPANQLRRDQHAIDQSLVDLPVALFILGNLP